MPVGYKDRQEGQFCNGRRSSILSPPDLFNEIDPPSSNPSYLTASNAVVYQAMQVWS